MTDKVAQITFGRFRTVIEACGARADRWPANEEHALQAFAATSAAAKSMLLESAALDALLEKAPSHAAGDFSGRVQRVVTAAVGSAQPLTAAGQAFAPQRPAAAGRHRRGRSLFGVTGQWHATALLAVSLMGGIAVGVLDLAPDPVDFVDGFARPKLEQPVAALDLDDVFDGFDEDRYDR